MASFAAVAERMPFPVDAGIPASAVVTSTPPVAAHHSTMQAICVHNADLEPR
jgi:hypothetical protein